jgi:hypothetical protein
MKNRFINEEANMIDAKWTRLGLLLIILVVFLVSAPPAGAYGEPEIDIKGTVFAIEHDKNDNVTSVSILEITGEEYFVIRDEIGDKLLKLVDKNLKATGVMYKDQDGKKRIKVLKFDIVGS